MTQIWAWIGSFILGMGVVWRVVEQYKGRVRQGLIIANETLDVINAVLRAIDDKKITKEEVEEILLEIQSLQHALKGE